MIGSFQAFIQYLGLSDSSGSEGEADTDSEENDVLVAIDPTHGKHQYSMTMYSSSEDEGAPLEVLPEEEITSDQLMEVFGQILQKGRGNPILQKQAQNIAESLLSPFDSTGKHINPWLTDEHVNNFCSYIAKTYNIEVIKSVWAEPNLPQSYAQRISSGGDLEADRDRLRSKSKIAWPVPMKFEEQNGSIKQTHWGSLIIEKNGNEITIKAFDNLNSYDEHKRLFALAKSTMTELYDDNPKIKFRTYSVYIPPGDDGINCGTAMLYVLEKYLQGFRLERYRDEGRHCNYNQYRYSIAKAMATQPPDLFFSYGEMTKKPLSQKAPSSPQKTRSSPQKMPRSPKIGPRSPQNLPPKLVLPKSVARSSPKKEKVAQIYGVSEEDHQREPYKNRKKKTNVNSTLRRRLFT